MTTTPVSGSSDVSCGGDATSDIPLTMAAVNDLAKDWQVELPPPWPDRPGNLLRFLWALMKAPITKSGHVEIPDELPGQTVPKYARQRFHGMPNGYYSERVADGYDKGFEVSMLGQVRGGRRRMSYAACGSDAERGAEAGDGPVRRALDLGCGSARLSTEFTARGVPEVWGLDASPYMLKIAQRRAPTTRFAQGVAEDTAFPDGYFDAIGACFLFHELPGYIARKTLQEAHRILRPGGLLCITDPCTVHTRPRSRWWLLWKHGPLAVYFSFLSKRVHEPFVADWLDIEDHAQWFAKEGFELVERDVRVPFLQLVARRIP